MKKIFTLFTAALFAASLWGSDVTVTIGSGTSTSYDMPLEIDGLATSKYHLSQHIYLNSDFSSTSGRIKGISFYIQSGTSVTRSLEIYINKRTDSKFGAFSSTFLASGTKVFDGNVVIPASEGWYSITLGTAYEWDGKNNIILTIYDKTGSKAGVNRQHRIYSGGSDNRSMYVASGSAITVGTSTTGTKSTNVPQIKFIFGDDTPTYDAPTNVSVLSKSSSTATIGWTKKDSATIKLQYKVQGAGSWIDSVGITGNSKQLNGLSAETTYDYQVFAVYPTGTSSAVTGSFTTDEASDHEHDGISFVAWNETTSLPNAAGNYYLKNNVTISSWTVPSGDTKICLNGKTISITGTGGTNYVNVGTGKSLSIYDNEGDGAVTAALNLCATIRVYGGSFSLFGGSINNTGSGSDAFAVNVASGTFNIKGNVKMSTSASAANIYLKNSGSIITLIGAITNSAKLSVKKAANQNITSGWSTQMGSADPADFFCSKNTDAPAVVLVGDEAQLGVPAVTISETGLNTIENGKLTNVNLVRTFQADILNTIALPFALTDAQLQDVFGDDYELYELSSSSLVGNVLELMFSKVTSLTGGAPYLLRVSESKVNPSFSSVTLTTATPSKVTTAVTMMPVISEKEVLAADYNLFLNAAGELNWATQTALFKGMRAYFHVTAAMPPSGVAVRRIVLGTDAATDLDNLEVSDKAVKRIENGQLVIERNGVRYDLNGQIIKMTK